LDPKEENETKTPVPDTSSRITGPDQQDLRTAYIELCISYRAIDDFRAKLLGFLPLASGTGIFLLFKYNQENCLQNETLPNETKMYLLPIGIFGLIITLGLFAYEIYGIQKCHCIIKTGKYIENEMKIRGQFRTRPRSVRLPVVGRVCRLLKIANESISR
jgi:hypothetical protein